MHRALQACSTSTPRHSREPIRIGNACLYSTSTLADTTFRPHEDGSARRAQHYCMHQGIFFRQNRRATVPVLVRGETARRSRCAPSVTTQTAVRLCSDLTDSSFSYPFWSSSRLAALTRALSALSSCG